MVGWMPGCSAEERVERGGGDRESGQEVDSMQGIKERGGRRTRPVWGWGH